MAIIKHGVMFIAKELGRYRVGHVTTSLPSSRQHEHVSVALSMLVAYMMDGMSTGKGGILTLASRSLSGRAPAIFERSLQYVHRRLGGVYPWLISSHWETDHGIRTELTIFAEVRRYFNCGIVSQRSPCVKDALEVNYTCTRSVSILSLGLDDLGR